MASATQLPRICRTRIGTRGEGGKGQKGVFAYESCLGMLRMILGGKGVSDIIAWQGVTMMRYDLLPAILPGNVLVQT